MINPATISSLSPLLSTQPVASSRLDSPHWKLRFGARQDQLRADTSTVDENLADSVPRSKVYGAALCPIHFINLSVPIDSFLVFPSVGQMERG